MAVKSHERLLPVRLEEENNNKQRVIYGAYQ